MIKSIKSERLIEIFREFLNIDTLDLKDLKKGLLAAKEFSLLTFYCILFY